MRYITTDDFKLFHQLEVLAEKEKMAEKKWLAEVEKSHQGKILYEDTKPLFDEYLAAHNEWKEFFDTHADIFLAKEIP